MNPLLQKDENGLWPGQQHPLDIPNFLRRKLVIIGHEGGLGTLQLNPATNPPASVLDWSPPWASKTEPPGA